MVRPVKRECLGSKLMDSSAFSLKGKVCLFRRVLNTVSPSFELRELAGLEAKVLDVLLPPCRGRGRTGP